MKSVITDEGDRINQPKTIWRAVMLELGSEPDVRSAVGFGAAAAYQNTDHCAWVNAVKNRFAFYGLKQGWHSKVTNYCIWLKEQEALNRG